MPACAGAGALERGARPLKLTAALLSLAQAIPEVAAAILHHFTPKPSAQPANEAIDKPLDERKPFVRRGGKPGHFERRRDDRPPGKPRKFGPRGKRP